MIPNHVLNEIARRLPGAKPKQIAANAKAIGIDLAMASDPPSLIEESAPEMFLLTLEDDLIRGAVPFEMTLSVLGFQVTQTCRAVYTATLFDDVNRFTGESMRVLGKVQIEWQVLSWFDLDHVDEDTGECLRLAVPCWRIGFEPLLPATVPNLILDQIEAQAVALEQARNQTHSQV